MNAEQFERVERSRLTDVLHGAREALGPSLSSLRPWPVFGDMMEPLLKRGDLMLCRPVSKFEGFGVYICGHGAIYTVDKGWGELRLMPKNDHYAPHSESYDSFARNVMAKVEYAITALGGKPVPGVIEASLMQGSTWQ